MYCHQYINERRRFITERKVPLNVLIDDRFSNRGPRAFSYLGDKEGEPSGVCVVSKVVGCFIV